MIDQAKIRRNMIDPAQIKRNIKAVDTDREVQMHMLEMHARAVNSTDIIQSPQGFYIYVLLDPRKPGNFEYGEYNFKFEPFYVGKGQRDRWKSHLQCKEGKKEKNTLIWEIILSGSPYSVNFVYESKNEHSVQEKEIEVIRTIGVASRNEEIGRASCRERV